MKECCYMYENKVWGRVQILNWRKLEKRKDEAESLFSWQNTWNNALSHIPLFSSSFFFPILLTHFLFFLSWELILSIYFFNDKKIFLFLEEKWSLLVHKSLRNKFTDLFPLPERFKKKRECDDEGWKKKWSENKRIEEN